MKSNILSVLAAAILAFSFSACSSSKTNSSTGTQTAASETHSFPAMAASSDMFERQSSELAKTRALNPAVHIFAKLMRDHHEETANELKTLAAGKNITLPTAMLPVHQRLMAPLNETGIGEKFDRRYMDAQITAHEQAITLFENASRNETDPELRAFASRVLPKLRDHLVMAKKAKDALD